MKHGGNARGRILAGAAFAGLFVYFAWIVVPGLAGEQDTSAPASSERTSGALGWLDPAEAPPRKGREVAPIDPASVLLPAPHLLDRGRTLFGPNCSACHGEGGRGDGPAARGLSPRPRDFSSAAGWTNGYHLTDVYRTIRSGVRSTAMAAFDYLTAADCMALAHYVRSLGTFDHGTEDAAALAELRSELGASGGRIPHRIPVSLAIRKLAKEEPPVRPLSPHDLIWDAERAARSLARAGAPPDAAALAAGAPSNGFRIEIATLAADDWRRLLEQLSEELR